MSTLFCPKCDGFMYSVEIHKCPPVWQTQIPYEGEDKWVDVMAYDAEGAAEKRAKEYNESGDVPLANENKVIILVRENASSPVIKFECSAEYKFDYYAKEVKENEDSRH